MPAGAACRADTPLVEGPRDRIQCGSAGALQHLHQREKSSSEGVRLRDLDFATDYAGQFQVAFGEHYRRYLR